MENKQEIDVNADKKQASDVYKKLPDDPNASQDDNSVSTADDSSGGQYSKTGTRNDEKSESNRQSN